MPTQANATALDNSEEDSTNALYRAAIGPVNTNYYLPRFAKFEATERAGLSWNWSAALLTLNWMAYRQLWGAALAYFGAVVAVALIVFGIGRLMFHFSEETELGLLLLLGPLSIAIPGALGNLLFYSATRKKIAAALEAKTTVTEACAMLEKKSSSRSRLIWQALANATLLGASVASYAALSQLDPLAVNPPKATEAKVEPATPPSAPVAPTPTTTAVTDVPAPSETQPTADASAPTAAVQVAQAPAPTTPAPAPVSPPLAVTPPVVPPAAVPAATPAVAAAAQPAPAIAVAPAAAAAAARNAPAAKANTKATAKTSEKASAKAKKDKAAAEASAKPASAPTAAPATTKFLINVGLFAKDENAHNAFTKLTDAGLPATSQELKTSKGKLIRVRVGPYATQAEADAAATKVRALNLEAMVIER